MSLREAIARQDTRGELERAAEDRFWDGLILAASEEGRELGSVYLLGYVAELLLKSAYYRVRGVPFDVDVRHELRGMDARARALGFAWQGNRHNLESVAQLLVAERRIRGNPLGAGIEVKLLGRIRLVSDMWSESLRYRSEPVGRDELNDVYSVVEWLRDKYAILWR